MKKEKIKEKYNGTLIVIAAAVLYILLGAILLLVPQIKVIYLCYSVSVLFVVTGIGMIVRYFMKESYKNINEYGFSFGALLVALGMCSMVREEQVSKSFVLCAGICILLTAIVKLQNAIDLRSLQVKVWPVILGASVILILCAVIIIINPFFEPQDLMTFTFVILIADGCISLVSIFFVSMNVARYNKDKKLPHRDGKEKITEEGSEDKQKKASHANHYQNTDDIIELAEEDEIEADWMQEEKTEGDTTDDTDNTDKGNGRVE